MMSGNNGLSRRALLTTSAAIGGLSFPAIMASRTYAADKEITIITWETYHDPAWLEEWTAKSGIKVNAVRVSSNDETYAKVRSGAVDADVLVIDAGSIPRFAGAGLLGAVDLSKVPNTSNISSGLNWHGVTTVQDKTMAVPYNWGTQPLMYNTKDIEPAPKKWKSFWNKEYKGKVVIPDDAYNVFPMITLMIGAKNPYALTDNEFKECIKALKELRPQLRTLARGFDDQTAIFASGEAELGYCQNISSVYQLQDQGKPFDYTFPEEGTPTWIDCSVLTPTGGKRPGVYEFINEMLTPKWQARFIKASFNNGILSDSGAIAAGVPQDVLKKTNIPSATDPKFWAKMSFYRNPENIDRRLQIWNAFKAGTL